jgi:hypothetical protein
LSLFSIKEWAEKTVKEISEGGVVSRIKQSAVLDKLKSSYVNNSSWWENLKTVVKICGPINGVCVCEREREPDLFLQ